MASRPRGWGPLRARATRGRVVRHLVPNLWAINFVKAVENANGRSVMHVRIPHEVVVETMEKIAVEEAKPALEEKPAAEAAS